MELKNAGILAAQIIGSHDITTWIKNNYEIEFERSGIISFGQFIKNKIACFIEMRRGDR
jgi:hypothetical protein